MTSPSRSSGQQPGPGKPDKDSTGAAAAAPSTSGGHKSPRDQFARDLGRLRAAQEKTATAQETIVDLLGQILEELRRGSQRLAAQEPEAAVAAGSPAQPATDASSESSEPSPFAQGEQVEFNQPALIRARDLWRDEFTDNPRASVEEQFQEVCRRIRGATLDVAIRRSVAAALVEAYARRFARQYRRTHHEFDNAGFNRLLAEAIQLPGISMLTKQEFEDHFTRGTQEKG
jgi:hypothetical protein